MDEVEKGRSSIAQPFAKGPDGGKHHIAVILGLLSMLLYIISFFLPATIDTVIDGKESYAPGYVAFYLSGMSLFSALIQNLSIFAAFLANPLLWAAAVFFCRTRYLLSWITTAMAIAFTMPLWYMAHQWLLVGYYAWITSMVLLLVASMTAWICARRGIASNSFEVIVSDVAARRIVR